MRILSLIVFIFSGLLFIEPDKLCIADGGLQRERAEPEQQYGDGSCESDTCAGQHEQGDKRVGNKSNGERQQIQFEPKIEIRGSL